MAFPEHPTDGAIERSGYLRTTQGMAAWASGQFHAARRRFHRDGAVHAGPASSGPRVDRGAFPAFRPQTAVLFRDSPLIHRWSTVTVPDLAQFMLRPERALGDSARTWGVTWGGHMLMQMRRLRPQRRAASAGFGDTWVEQLCLPRVNGSLLSGACREGDLHEPLRATRSGAQPCCWPRTSARCRWAVGSQRAL